MCLVPFCFTTNLFFVRRRTLLPALTLAAAANMWLCVSGTFLLQRPALLAVQLGSCGDDYPPSDRIPCRCHVALCTAPPGLPSLLPQLQTHCPAFLPHALSAGEQNTWGHMWCNATHSGAVWCSVVHFTTLGPGLASLCCSQTRNSPCCWAAGDPTCLNLACWGKSRWAKRAGQHHPPLGTLRTRPCILCNVVQCGASDATSSCCVAKGVLTALQQAGTTADVCDLVWWCKVSPVGLKNCVRRSVQA